MEDCMNRFAKLVPVGFGMVLGLAYARSMNPECTLQVGFSFNWISVFLFVVLDACIAERVFGLKTAFCFCTAAATAAAVYGSFANSLHDGIYAGALICLFGLLGMFSYDGLRRIVRW